MREVLLMLEVYLLVIFCTFVQNLMAEIVKWILEEAQELLILTENLLFGELI